MGILTQHLGSGLEHLLFDYCQGFESNLATPDEILLLMLQMNIE